MYEGSQKLHKFFRGLVDVNPTGKRKTQLDAKQREVWPPRPPRPPLHRTITLA